MTTLPITDAHDDARPRKISRKAAGADAVFEHGARAVGASVLVITGGVGLFLAWQAYPTLNRYGWSFFTETQWQPESDVLGIAAVLTGTISVALVAMFFAFPLALLTALYISEYAPPGVKSTLVCASGENLSSGTGWSAAVYSYNHARSYVDAVRAAASQYAARSAA